MSRLIRRLHMYLALGLIPWVSVYATSTLVMNHRDYFQKNADKTRMRRISVETEYHANFSADADVDAKAQQILKDLGMEGGYSVDRRFQDEKLVIYRQIPGRERKITYYPSENRLIVEQSEFQMRNFIDDLHTRHGFGSRYLGPNLWAVLVDLVSVTMIVWALSGIYMWWELKKTRIWGALSLGAGAISFAALLTAL